MNGDDFGSLIYLALLLLALGGWAMMEYRARMGEMLRVAAAWGLIFLAVAAGYGLWGNLRGDIVPRQRVDAGQVIIPRAQDGHYYVDLTINGIDISMMADTGASGIVLAQADAQALGIDLASLRYLGTAMTANGEVRTARALLDTITLGPFTDTGVTAFVNEGEMEGSLLGMEYLGRFNISLADDQMELRRRN